MFYDTSKPARLCDTIVHELACDIHNSYQSGRIDLMSVNQRGIVDGADALSNIADTCAGEEAARSR